MFRLPLTDPDRDYAALRAFVAPARSRPELWRTVVGCVLATTIYVGTTMVVVATLLSGYDSLTATILSDAVANGRTQAGMVGLFLTFVPMALGVFAAARLLHDRAPSSLFGPRVHAVPDFLRVALPAIGLSAILLPLVTLSENVGRHMTFAEQVLWYPLALPGLLIQVGAEEVAFRGYLLQQLGARFRSPLAWMVLPSALFGALHWAPDTFGPAAWVVVLWATLFGILAADLTARTGTLGAAIGFHFATNFAALFLTGLYGNLDGLALFNLVIDLSDPRAIMPYLLVDFVGMVVVWLLARVMLRV